MCIVVYTLGQDWSNNSSFLHDDLIYILKYSHHQIKIPLLPTTKHKNADKLKYNGANSEAKRMEMNSQSIVANPKANNEYQTQPLCCQ